MKGLCVRSSTRPCSSRSLICAACKGGALEDEWREFGVESPTGHSWYNFEPLIYLECALAGISANNVDGGSLTPGWRPFAWFLELGRMYEEARRPKLGSSLWRRPSGLCGQG